MCFYCTVKCNWSVCEFIIRLMIFASHAWQHSIIQPRPTSPKLWRHIVLWRHIMLWRHICKRPYTSVWPETSSSQTQVPGGGLLQQNLHIQLYHILQNITCVGKERLLILHEEPSPIEELNHCRDSDELVTGVSYGKLQWISLLYIIMLLILTLAHRCFKEPWMFVVLPW